ncbi:MAG: PUA domain-containing protein [Nitrososphaeria archaeon]
MRKLKDLPYILNYIYGDSVGELLDLKNFKPLISKRTGKVKQLFYKEKLFATFRPNGSFAPTPQTYNVLSKKMKNNVVTVKDDALPHIRKGSSIFVQNIKQIGKNIHVGSDVFILDSKGNLIGLGKSTISSKQIKHFKSGLCVKNRG